jgi:hypothetical protein
MRVSALRLAIFVAAGLFIGCASVQPVREVREGALYRSGQLSPAQLETAVKEHRIRTVVNLRGKQSDARWYRDQTELLRDLKVKQVDVALGASEPDPEAVAELLATFKEEDKPILVHSYWSQGSAGLASGLYRVAIEKETPDAARRELALWQTKHLPFIPGGEHDRYLAEWKGERRATSGVVAAKRRVDSALEDYGLAELAAPLSEVAERDERTPARRFPWSSPAAPKSEAASDTQMVMLGPPKVIPEDRLADRTDRRRY